jgi:hypothetical protein
LLHLLILFEGVCVGVCGWLGWVWVWVGGWMWVMVGEE